MAFLAFSEDYILGWWIKYPLFSSTCCFRMLPDIRPNNSQISLSESVNRGQSVIEDLVCWLFLFPLDNMSSFHQVPNMENNIELVC